jgi:hypothetical protein
MLGAILNYWRENRDNTIKIKTQEYKIINKALIGKKNKLKSKIINNIVFKNKTSALNKNIKIQVLWK